MDHQGGMHLRWRGERVPGWRVRAHNERVEHREKRFVADVRFPVEGDRTAALPGDCRERRIEEGTTGQWQRRWAVCRRLRSRKLPRGAMNRIDIRPLHVFRAQTVGATGPGRLA